MSLKTHKCTKKAQTTPTMGTTRTSRSKTHTTREAVLLQLPLKDLFPIQRACKRFRDVIAASPKLQQKLFLRPSEKLDKTWRQVRYLEEWESLSEFHPPQTPRFNRNKQEPKPIKDEGSMWNLIEFHISHLPPVRLNPLLRLIPIPAGLPTLFRLPFTTQTKVDLDSIPISSSPERRSTGSWRSRPVKALMSSRLRGGGEDRSTEHACRHDALRRRILRTVRHWIW
jgi:hypothetical protein